MLIISKFKTYIVVDKFEITFDFTVVWETHLLGLLYAALVVLACFFGSTIFNVFIDIHVVKVLSKNYRSVEWTIREGRSGLLLGGPFV